MKKDLTIFLLLWLLISIALQLLVGGVDITFVSFPINVVIILVLAGVLFVCNREYGNSKIIALLASKEMSVAAMIIMAAASLVIGIVPQTSDSPYVIVNRLLLDNFISSPVFYTSVLLLIVNLILVILRYKSSRTNIWRFRLNHIGLLVVICGLSFGAADTQRLRAVVNIGDTIDRAFDFKGYSKALNYSFSLKNFNVEYYDNGVPSAFSAVGEVNSKPIEISVNHPCRASWQDDIYLVGYDEQAGAGSEYCIIEFIRQPWKYIVVFGVVMMAIGALMLFKTGHKKGSL